MKRFTLIHLLISFFTFTAISQWSTSALSSSRSLTSSSSFGLDIYVAGGATYSSNEVSDIVDIYSTETLGWTTDTLSQARFVLSSAASSENVFFGGGVTNLNSAAVSSRVDIYSPATMSWQTAELSESRGALTATSDDHTVLFAGGISNFITGTTSLKVDIYSETTHEWTSAELSIPRGYLASTSAQGKAFFAGGIVSYSGNSALVTNRIDIYDYETGEWSIDSLSVPRGGLAASSMGNKVVFAGGHDPDYASLNIVDIYDIANDTWSTDTLSQARGELTACTLNNKIYFAGGYSNYGELIMSDRVDIYDATTETWSTATLSQARSELTSASANGTLLISGGGSHGSGLEFNTVDIFYDNTTGYLDKESIHHNCDFKIINEGEKNSIKISYFQKKSGPVEIRIIDLNGKKILEKYYDHQIQGMFNEKMAIRNKRTPAILICCLKSNDGICSKKFILMDK